MFLHYMEHLCYDKDYENNEFMDLNADHLQNLTHCFLSKSSPYQQFYDNWIFIYTISSNDTQTNKHEHQARQRHNFLDRDKNTLKTEVKRVQKPFCYNAEVN